MATLIDLVHEYRNLSESNEKIEVAQRIIIEIAPSITLFLLGHSAVDDVPDLRQMAFVAIVKGLDGFRGDSEAEFWAWCYQIGRKVLAKHFEKAAKKQTESVDPEELIRLVEASSEREALSSEERTILRDALEILERAMPECFSLLWRRYILDIDIREIANDLDVAFDAARMKIKRCLDSAAALLKDS